MEKLSNVRNAMKRLRSNAGSIYHETDAVRPQAELSAVDQPAQPPPERDPTPKRVPVKEQPARRQPIGEPPGQPEPIGEPSGEPQPKGEPPDKPLPKGDPPAPPS